MNRQSTKFLDDVIQRARHNTLYHSCLAAHRFLLYSFVLRRRRRHFSPYQTRISVYNRPILTHLCNSPSLHGTASRNQGGTLPRRAKAQRGGNDCSFLQIFFVEFCIKLACLPDAVWRIFKVNNTSQKFVSMTYHQEIFRRTLPHYPQLPPTENLKKTGTNPYS